MDSAQYEQQIRDLNSQLGSSIKGNEGQNIISRGLKEAYGYGAPLIKEAANAEAAAYKMPGQLLGAYTGIGNPLASGRIQSNLNDMGMALQRANVARGLANNQMGYLGDVSANLGGQYQDYLSGLQQQISNLTPLYQSRLSAEENAKSRAASARQQQSFANVAEYLRQLQAMPGVGQQANSKYAGTPYEALQSQYLSTGKGLAPAGLYQTPADLFTPTRSNTMNSALTWMGQ